MTYTCINPHCSEPNPQPRSHFYTYSGGCRKLLCITCYKRKVSERVRKDRPNPNGRYYGSKHDRAPVATDPYLPLCADCLLDDCIRPEGAYRAGNYKYKTFEGCLVWVAELAQKLDIDEVRRKVEGK